jgi:hypothetical protein
MFQSGVQTRAAGLAFASLIILAVFIGTAYASVLTGMPKADGAFTQWTPSTGTAHWSLVDETPCNGTTDYVSTNTTGQRDSYVVSTTSVPTGAVITQIAIKPCAARNASGGGSSQLDVFYRFNGANSADAGAYAVPTGTTPADLATTTFSGLSLLQGTSSQLEIGAVYTSGTKGLRLSRIGSSVTYTAAPTGLSATATTSSTIRITWTDASDNETSFSIERSLDASNWSLIATTSANVTSFYNSGLSASTTYYYRVRATAGTAATAYTNTASATTLGPVPNAPSNLGLTKQPGVGSTTDIVLNWTDNSSDETGFTVERQIGLFAPFIVIASTTANVATYTDAGLSTTTTTVYSYRVRAYNGNGNSAYSNTASTTLP